jgi:hypothetical protein
MVSLFIFILIHILERESDEEREIDPSSFIKYENSTCVFINQF